MLTEQQFENIKNWVHLNAREMELTMWKYHFEDGSKEDVLSALSAYQNADGGFGHALEADNWNPNSSPITTLHAIKMLNDLEYFDLSHAIYQGIMAYLTSQKDLMDNGWRFTIASNDDYPHAPWWNYSETANQAERYDVTAQLCAFILTYFEQNSALYQKALLLVKELIAGMLSSDQFGDMGIEGFIVLIGTLRRLRLDGVDCDKMENRLHELVKQAIDKDASRWSLYGVRPSNYIKSPTSPFFEENKELVLAEYHYLLDTLPQNDVWGITWTWFDNLEQYAKQFAISENWWKSEKALANMRFIRNFQDLAPYHPLQHKGAIS